MELTDPMTQINDIVINKYKTAGKIASCALEKVVKLTKVGANIYDLCMAGNRCIEGEVVKVYKNITDKGIAFPTSISINEIAGSYCPSSTDKTIEDGDIVKIELGVHIDGYPALVACTVIAGTISENDKRAKIVLAVSEASKEILKNMKVGKTNCDVVNILNKCSEKYNCSLPSTDHDNFEHTPGIISYQISQYIIDGHNDDDDEFVHRLILNKPSSCYDFELRETPFEEDEVYAIDIVMTTGNGKLFNDGCHVHKRAINRKTSLRLKAAREALGKFGKNKFPIRTSASADSKFKFGIKNCIDNKLVEAYPIMKEKDGEYVARIKFTAIVKKDPILVVARSLDDQVKKIEKNIG